MKLFLDNNGKILKADAGSFGIPFTSAFGFSYVADCVEYKIDLKKTENGFGTVQNGVAYSLSYEENEKYFAVNIRVDNQSGYDFSPELTIFNLGVDSYMESYPEWNEKFFPTLLRCEKTHLFGYFMNTKKESLAIVSSEPFTSYDYTYTSTEANRHLGHRLTGQRLHITNRTDINLERADVLKNLKKGQIYENKIYFIPLNRGEDILENIAKIGKVPMIAGDKFTYDKGERLKLNIISDEEYNAYLISPGGKICDCNKFVFDEFGLYTLKVETTSGKVSEAKLYCKKDWKFYLENAAKEAILKPQKATTHTESWYGLFSMFLAAKRFNDKKLFEKAMECFDEIMPLMFDFEKLEPIVIPQRIQNTSALVSLLTDIYECGEEENIKYLKYASGFADFLIKNQGEDGAYYNNNTHYTCVIYIAKSILELCIAEKNSKDKTLNKKSVEHFNSVKRAIDNLKERLEDIQTEGEQTLEDGMISCSALQIGMFAENLPKELRGEYIKAAEHMIDIHNCLEQTLIPDCRMRGASLRFWEAQYDVMIRANFFNSPHGWSAWTSYAYYYLYMLTGKREYLVNLMNITSACVQLISEKGELRWAFCAQPYVKSLALSRDKEIKSGGYSFSRELGTSYSGKYEYKEFGEGYVPMISSWYKIAENKVVGGYEFCPLIINNEFYITDNNGGCCDNDVHEIFKCLEETVYDKAFIYENEDGTFLTYGINAEQNGDELMLDIINGENILCYNFKSKKKVVIGGEKYNFENFGVAKLNAADKTER